jgi:nitroreductase
MQANDGSMVGFVAHEVQMSTTDPPINKLIKNRHSPLAFDDTPLDEADIDALFEAARWAPSSQNAQPWRFVVAPKNTNPLSYRDICGGLVPGNQVWAMRAPVLAVAITSRQFPYNGDDNPHAHYDLGAAVAMLTIEATARGIHVHQMAGIHRDKLREMLQVPENHDVVVVLAIGYEGDPEELPQSLQDRSSKPRTRRPQSDWRFAGRFGNG